MASAVTLPFAPGLPGWDVHANAATPIRLDGRPALRFEGDGGKVLWDVAPSAQAFRMEAPIFVPGREGFAGLLYAAEDADNHELVYVYPADPADEGAPGWIQVDPVMNGSNTWQVYHAPPYRVQADVPSGAWVRLALAVYPDRVAAWAGEGEEPLLVVAHPRSGSGWGRVGIWAYLPCIVGEVTVSPLAEPWDVPPLSPTLQTCPGTITRWLVPEALDETPDGTEAARLDARPHGWREVGVEAGGVLNLNRLFRAAQGACVRARACVQAATGGMALLRLGFSDHLRLWVNDEPAYEGDHRWEPPHRDGRIRPDVVRVPVRLQPGQNELVADVRVDEPPFGWGLAAAVEPASG